MRNILLFVLLMPLVSALPAFSAITPTGGSTMASTSIAYTLSENLTYGYATWQRTSGTSDTAIHVQALEASERTAGSFSGILTNPPVLVEDAVYTITLSGGNANGDTTARVTNVLYHTASGGSGGSGHGGGSSSGGGGGGGYARKASTTTNETNHTTPTNVTDVFRIPRRSLTNATLSNASPLPSLVTGYAVADAPARTDTKTWIAIAAAVVLLIALGIVLRRKT